MNNEEFRREVEKQLNGFSNEKIIYFSWLCAVKVLPILGINGSFVYWDTEHTCKHLCSIFHALDITADMIRLFNTNYSRCINANSRSPHYEVDDNLTRVPQQVLHATDAANVFATHAVHRAQSSTKLENRTEVANAARAAYAARSVALSAAGAAFAAVYAAIQTDQTVAIHSAAKAAAAAAATIDATYAYTANARPNINFPNSYITIINDLQSIRLDMPIAAFNMSDFVGEIWQSFINALELEDCSYWGDLYGKIFENGFIIDLEATRHRINIPDDIKKQGASAVAKYLERAENADC